MKQQIMLEHHPNDSRVKLEESEHCQSMTSRMGTGGGNVPLLLERNDMEEYRVRRLTPLECTRLQGYPDDWLQLPQKNDMSDEEVAFWNEVRKAKCNAFGKVIFKKKNKEQTLKWYNSMITADSNKYKALGNSIALPQWYLLFDRMKEYLPEHPTMASLFDGIGGFPITFEDVFGKGSCLWASEIEEYPIAVTQYHFGEEQQCEN